MIEKNTTNVPCGKFVSILDKIIRFLFSDIMLGKIFTACRNSMKWTMDLTPRPNMSLLFTGNGAQENERHEFHVDSF